MLAVVYLLLGFVPPLAAGPLAGIAFIEILRRRKLWYQVPFWALLVFLNLLIMYWVARSAAAWLSLSSLSAFFATPVASILTLPVMHKFWRRLEAAGGLEAAHKNWLPAGLVLIPALQLGFFIALLIFAPSACKADLVGCLDL
jgi:hypothetical protein